VEYSTAALGVVEVRSMQPKPQKGSSPVLGWGVFPLFYYGGPHVLRGSFIVPLLQGAPSRVRFPLLPSSLPSPTVSMPSLCWETHLHTYKMFPAVNVVDPLLQELLEDIAEGGPSYSASMAAMTTGKAPKLKFTEGISCLVRVADVQHSDLDPLSKVCSGV
jgi:hypothetical protein